MSYFYKVIFTLALFTLNFCLLYLFSVGLYSLYFLFLFMTLYIVYKFYAYFSFLISVFFLILVLVLINLDIYEECIFELYLYFNLLDKSIYLNSEVSYALVVLHLILLNNLKKFEFIWAIIDKKLFRI